MLNHELVSSNAVRLSYLHMNHHRETNSEDPDEMQHHAAFHLGFHCLLEYSFRVSQIQRVNFGWGYNETYRLV